MKKMMFLSKNWYFSVQKVLIYHTVNKSHHNSFILLGTNKYCILQYADDSTLTLKNKVSIIECIKILENFSTISGLKLNTKKCQGIWLGQLKGSENVFQQINFTKEPIKCLGIYIGTEAEKCTTKNWDKKITEVEELLLKWSNRKLTLYGKATVINSLIIPKLIYNCSILTVPTTVIKELNKQIFGYLWGKNHKIRKTTIIGSYDKGGLKITDLESKIYAIKTSWIPKLLANNSISKILQSYLSELGLDLKTLLKMNFKSAKSFEIIKYLPQFYQDIFIYYNNCKIIKPVDEIKLHDFMTQTIWGNEYFKQKHKTLYFKNWIKSGFILVKDLFQDNGHWLEEIEVLNSLQNTSNWIVEYMTLKKVIGKVSKKHDTKIVLYIQKPLLEKLTFTIKDNIIDPMSIKPKEMYNILIARKFERPYSEKMWERILGLKLLRADWSAIYIYNMKALEYKKFAEFKYKVLLNILPCGEKIHKWNRNVSDCCAFCKDKESIIHILYECKRVKEIWKIIGHCLRMLIQLKHIILGITDPHYVELNRHLCIVIVSYSIYATWCKCSFENINYGNMNLKHSVISYLTFYFEVYRSTDIRNTVEKEHLKYIIESIIFCLNK